LAEKPTDADWVLKVMVAVAASDARLDAREVRLIQKVYQEQTGRAVDVSGVALAVQTYATKRDVLPELSAAAGSMSPEAKEEIVRAAYRTLLADERIAEREWKKLKEIVAALHISEARFEAIIAEAGSTS
jgi:tellurite resistance protein